MGVALNQVMDLVFSGKYAQVEVYLDEVEIENCSNPELVMIQARLERMQGNFEHALSILDNMTPGLFDNPRRQLFFTIERASNLMRQGDNELAMELVQDAKSIKADTSDNVEQRFVLELYDLEGKIHINESKLEAAKSSIKNGLTLAKRVSYPLLKASLLNALGVIHFFKGHIKEANQCYFDSLLINKELENKRQIGITYNNIGYNYYIMRDGSLALKYGKMAYEIFTELEIDYYHATSMFNLLRTHLFLKNIDQAEKLFEEVQELASKPENSENKRIRSIHKLCDALITEQGDRLRNKLEAQEKFTEIIEDEMESQFVIIAMIHLANLLLIELKVSDDEEILQEINEIANKIEMMAEKNNSIYLETYVYLLYGKLKTVMGKYQEAYDYYRRAEEYAKENDIKLLQDEAVEDLQNMKENVMKMREILERSTSVSERIEHAEITNYLDSLKNII